MCDTPNCGCAGGSVPAAALRKLLAEKHIALPRELQRERQAQHESARSGIKDTRLRNSLNFKAKPRRRLRFCGRPGSRHILRW
jgi:hypothetical protein